MISESSDIFSRHWLRWLLLLWVLTAVGLVIYRWPQINWFALGDTDDNMRMMQVRALLGGQDWYDLRQYRLNPPVGANIHWSHLVDLPMAVVILAFKPFFGGAVAEKIAIAIGPMIPLGVVFVGLLRASLWPLPFSSAHTPRC
jgi:asparagine N-glycosylation enzyme membrane subunit Stt3